MGSHSRQCSKHQSFIFSFFFFFFAFHMNTYNWITYKIFIYYWFFHFQDLYPWRMLPMCKNCVTGSAIWSITFDCWLWWEWTMFVSVNLHALFIASYWSVMIFERDQCNNTHFLLLLNICNYFSNIFVNDVFRKVMFIVYFLLRIESWSITLLSSCGPLEYNHGMLSIHYEFEFPHVWFALHNYVLRVYKGNAHYMKVLWVFKI